MRTAFGRPMMAVLAIAVLLAAGGRAWAVHPQAWVHQAQSDYIEGTFDNVVVDSYGTLKLGRQLTELSAPEAGEFVNAFAEGKDGTIYCATSPAGNVYTIKDGKAHLWFAPPKDFGQVLSLAVAASGDLLVAVAGDKGSKLLRVSAADGKATSREIWSDESIRYIWSIKERKGGVIDLGTGPQGEVVELDAAGKESTLLESRAKNILAMTVDHGGNLVVGTDGSGLVIRVDDKTGKPFVLLDAGDVDITSLTTDEAGNIYAAAATVADERQQDRGNPKADDQGKPGNIEPEMEAPADDGGDTQPKPTPKPTPAGTRPAADGRSALALPAGLYADVISPQELKTLLAHAKLSASRREGASHPKHPRQPAKKHNSTPGDDTDQLPVNAVYKIALDGTITRLLTNSDTMLSLAWQNGLLYVGTGTGGKVYALDVTDQSQTLVARVHDENVMSLLAAADGRLWMGTSNAAGIYTLGAGVAKSGTYTSKVLNAGHAASWGSAGILATGDGVTFETRSGNTGDADEAEQFWSPWSAEVPAGATGGKATKIQSPAAKYLQYRLTFKDGKNAASVSQVKVGYQVHNLPPVIASVSADAPASDQGDDSGPGGSSPPIGGGSSHKPEATEPSRNINVTWDASDPNNDTLTFRVLYQRVGTDLWLTAGKDLKGTSFDWDTRTLPDGQYIIKVIASDIADNSKETALSAARQTAPVLVDNTPPAISDLKVSVDAGKATIEGVAKDAISAVVDVRYQVDGEGGWHLATASDKMFDSPSEAFTFTTRGLAVGGHQVAVRATDEAGNVAYKSVTVVVK